MKQRLTMFLLLIFSYISNGQEIIHVQLAKKIISADFQKNFKNYQIFQLNPSEIQKKLNQRNSKNTIQFSIGHDFDWTIQLDENDILSTNYSIDAFTEEGKKQMPISKVKAYRGLTKKNEEVRLTIGKDFFYGYITQNGVKFFIEPALYFDKTATKDKFVIYSEKDVIQNKDNTCAVIHADEKHVSQSQILQERPAALTGGCAEIELAIASDYKMFQEYGSVAGVEAHNIGVMNNVQSNYDDEFEKEIKFKIVKQVVITCNGCDPWDATRNPSQVLGNFGDWGNLGGFGNTSYDLAQFWTNRDFNGGVIGIAHILGLGVMCTPIRYHAIQNFSSNSSLVRVVVAHEIGHNLSAFHSSNGYIMNAFVNNTDRWAQSSINSINDAVQSKVDNGCLSVCTPILPPDLGDPNVHLSLDYVDSSPETCFEAKDGAISLSVSGGFPDYAYFWNVNGLQGPKVQNLSPGIYQCTIVDQNFASVITSPIVIDGSESPLTIEIDNILPQSCDGGFTGGISITADGGSPPYFYNWSNGYLVDDINEIDAGSYSVTVLDANGCFTVMSDIEIPSGDVPVASAQAIENINCLNEIVVLDGSNSDHGANNYFLWTTDDGNILDGANTLHPSVNAPGEYTLTVFNGTDDCFSTSVVNVFEDRTEPEIQLDEVGVLNCNNTSLVINTTISNTNNVSISWSTADGNIQSGASAQNPTINQAGNYQVIVTNNENGCQAEAQIEVLSNFTEPIIQINTPDILDCNNANTIISADVSENTSIQWSTNDGNIVDIQNNLITVDQVGTYTLVATHNESGCTTEFSTTVQSNQSIPSISFDEIQKLDCNNESVVINAFVDKTVSYEWTASDGQIINGFTDNNLTVTQAGDYTLTVISENGCQATATISVSQAPDLIADFQNVIHNNCFGDSNGQAHIQISSGTAPYNYAWSNGMNQETATNLPAGEYQVIVSDAAGCSFEKSIVISQPEQLNTDISENNGTYSANASGGTAPYSYQWSTGENSSTISPTEPGSYSVEITDANGCVQTESFNIDKADCALSSSITSNDITCFGLENGSATVEIQGATGNISYQWSNDQTTQNIESLSPGTYFVTATDENDCQIVEQINITQPDELILSSSTSDVLCNADANGRATITATGGTLPYSYVWNTSDQDFTIENINAGIYSCEVTDANGCKQSQSVAIEEPEKLTIKPLITDVSIPGGSDGEIIVGINGGTPPYRYLWMNGETTNELTNLKAGSYSLDVTDAHECMISLDFVISEPGIVVIDITKTDVLCFDEKGGSAMVNITQGESPFTYLWDNSEETQSISNLKAGNYSVTVTDNLGVTATSTVEITQPNKIELSIFPIGVSCFDDTNGSVTINVSGGTEPYNQQWSSGQSTNLSPGDYFVTVVDANNCTASAKFIISSPDEIIVENEITNSNVNDNTGAIDISPAGGREPYRFVWSNGETSEDLTNLSPGDYTLLLTDKNDCTFEETYTVHEIVGTNEILTDENLSINPNPSKGDFILEMDIVSRKSIQIDIFNVTGQKISADIQELAKNERYQIHLSPVAGVYFMKLRLEGEVLVKKLVVN